MLDLSACDYVCILKFKKRHVVKISQGKLKTAFLLGGLNVMSHCLAHCDNSIKTWLMRPWISSRHDVE